LLGILLALREVGVVVVSAAEVIIVGRAGAGGANRCLGVEEGGRNMSESAAAVCLLLFPLDSRSLLLLLATIATLLLVLPPYIDIDTIMMK
jgi:hypothetical protein